MNDHTKTLVFLGIAVVAVALAFLTRPSPADPVDDDPRGELLFDEFSADDVAELQIVKYESKNLNLQTLLTEGKLKPTSLVVKREGESWVLPSHDGYPVDAEGKVAAAASALLGLEIDGVASDNPADHEDYGVVQPNIDRFDIEAAGVGTLVRLNDATGNALVNIVVGDEVKKVGDVSGQRYVRRADQDRVYIVRVDPNEMSTQFKDWITEDLLKLTAGDIKKLTLNDYAIIEQFGRAGIVPRSESTFDKDGSDWKVVSIMERDEKTRELKDRKLTKDEEIDNSKLGDLTRAMANLKIVDVREKSESLAAALRQGQLVGNDQESFVSLQKHGFFPDIREGKIHIFSDQGEVKAGLESGVEYVLRFGRTAGLGDEEESDEKADGEKEKKVGLNRYIFVTTRFNQDLIPKPEIKELPKLEDYLPKKKPAEPKDGEPKDGDAKKDDAKEEPTTGNTTSPSGTEGDDEKPADDAKEEHDHEHADDKKAEPGKKDDTKKADDKPEKTPEEQTKEVFERELAKVKSDNKKNQEDYDKKVVDGKKLVENLNVRFADWFYVISEGEYDKIHLGVADLIKKKGDHSGHNHPPIGGDGPKLPGDGLRIPGLTPGG